MHGLDLHLHLFDHPRFSFKKEQNKTELALSISLYLFSISSSISAISFLTYKLAKMLKWQILKTVAEPVGLNFINPRMWYSFKCFNKFFDKMYFSWFWWWKRNFVFFYILFKANGEKSKFIRDKYKFWVKLRINFF